MNRATTTPVAAALAAVRVMQDRLADLEQALQTMPEDGMVYLSLSNVEQYTLVQRDGGLAVDFWSTWQDHPAIQSKVTHSAIELARKITEAIAADAATEVAARLVQNDIGYY